MNKIGYISVSAVLLMSCAAFAKPITLTETLSTKDHKTSAGISRGVVAMAQDIDGIQVNCKPESSAENQKYLNFSFKFEKISRREIKATVTSPDEENSISFGGDGIIEVTTGPEFSQLILGDDGRRVITFATPGKKFGSWGAGVKGVCESVSVAAYFDGFGPADVAECCAQMR